MPISVFPVCSPELARSLHDVSDLADQTLLHVHQLPNAWDEWLGAVGADDVNTAHARKNDMHFNDVHLTYEAAQRGLGVAIGADVVIGDYLEDGRLVAPFTQLVPSAFSYHLVCAKSQLRNPAAQKLRRWLKACAAKSDMH